MEQSRQVFFFLALNVWTKLSNFMNLPLAFPPTWCRLPSLLPLIDLLWRREKLVVIITKCKYKQVWMVKSLTFFDIPSFPLHSLCHIEDRWTICGPKHRHRGFRIYCHYRVITDFHTFKRRKIMANVMERKMSNGSGVTAKIASKEAYIFTYCTNKIIEPKPPVWGLKHC